MNSQNMSGNFFQFNKENDILFSNFRNSELNGYGDPYSERCQKIWLKYLSVWDGANATRTRDRKIDGTEIKNIYEELKNLYGQDGILTEEEADSYLKSKNNDNLTGKELLEMLKGAMTRALQRNQNDNQNINETEDKNRVQTINETKNVDLNVEFIESELVEKTQDTTIQLQEYLLNYYIKTYLEAQDAIKQMGPLDFAGSYINTGVGETITASKNLIRGTREKYTSFGDLIDKYDQNVQKVKDAFNALKALRENGNINIEELAKYIPNFNIAKALEFKTITERYDNAKILNQRVELLKKIEKELTAAEDAEAAARSSLSSFGPNITTAEKLEHETNAYNLLLEYFNNDAEVVNLYMQGTSITANPQTKSKIQELLNDTESQLKTILNKTEKEITYTDSDGKEQTVKITSPQLTLEQLKEEYKSQYKQIYKDDFVPEELIEKTNNSITTGGLVKIGIITIISILISKSPAMANAMKAVAGSTEVSGAAAEFISSLVSKYGQFAVQQGIKFAMTTGTLAQDVGLTILNQAFDGREGIQWDEVAESAKNSAKYIYFGSYIGSPLAQTVTGRIGQLGLTKNLFNGGITKVNGNITRTSIGGNKFIQNLMGNGSKIANGTNKAVNFLTNFSVNSAAFAGLEIVSGDIDIETALEESGKMQLELTLMHNLFEYLLGGKVHTTLSKAQLKEHNAKIEQAIESSGIKDFNIEEIKTPNENRKDYQITYEVKDKNGTIIGVFFNQNDLTSALMGKIHEAYKKIEAQSSQNSNNNQELKEILSEDFNNIKNKFGNNFKEAHFTDSTGILVVEYKDINDKNIRQIYYQTTSQEKLGEIEYEDGNPIKERLANGEEIPLGSLDAINRAQNTFGTTDGIKVNAGTNKDGCPAIIIRNAKTENVIYVAKTEKDGNIIVNDYMKNEIKSIMSKEDVQNIIKEIQEKAIEISQKDDKSIQINRDINNGDKKNDPYDDFETKKDNWFADTLVGSLLIEEYEIGKIVFSDMFNKTAELFDKISDSEISPKLKMKWKNCKEKFNKLIDYPMEKFAELNNAAKELCSELNEIAINSSVRTCTKIRNLINEIKSGFNNFVEKINASRASKTKTGLNSNKAIRDNLKKLKYNSYSKQEFEKLLNNINLPDDQINNFVETIQLIESYKGTKDDLATILGFIQKNNITDIKELNRFLQKIVISHSSLNSFYWLETIVNCNNNKLSTYCKVVDYMREINPNVISTTLTQVIAKYDNADIDKILNISKKYINDKDIGDLFDLSNDNIIDFVYEFDNIDKCISQLKVLRKKVGFSYNEKEMNHFGRKERLNLLKLNLSDKDFYRIEELGLWDLYKNECEPSYEIKILLAANQKDFAKLKERNLTPNSTNLKLCQLTNAEWKIVQKYDLTNYSTYYECLKTLVQKGEAYIQKIFERKLEKNIGFYDNSLDYVVNLSDADFKKFQERGSQNYGRTLNNYSVLFTFQEQALLAQISDKDWPKAKELLFIPERGDVRDSNWGVEYNKKLNQFSVEEVIELLQLNENDYNFLKESGALKTLNINSLKAVIDAQCFVGKQNLQDLTTGEIKRLQKFLVKHNANIFNDDFVKFAKEKLNTNIFPKTQEDYCKLLPKLVNSNKLEVTKISEETKNNYQKAMDKLADPNGAFLKTNLDSPDFKLEMSYSRNDFINDIGQLLDGLTIAQRNAISDVYGFELANKNGQLVMNGYPCIPKDLKSVPAHLVDKINACIRKYTQENKITVKNNPELSAQLNDIVKAFPEFAAIIGKVQHGVHDYTVDVHTLKVLQGVMSHPEYKNLSASEKRIIQISTLMHDIAKKEMEVDKSHPSNSAYDTYYILEKMNLTEEEKTSIFKIIKNHDWLERYNTPNHEEQNIISHIIAYELQSGNNFKLASILCEADLKGVQKNNTFFNQYKAVYEKEVEKISKIVDYLKSTQICMPISKIPKASQIKADGKIIEERIIKGRKVKILHLQEGVDLSKYGFAPGTTTDNLTLMFHGILESNSSSTLDALSQIDSDALISTSLYGVYKPPVYCNHGYFMRTNSSNILTGSYENLGSGRSNQKNLYNMIKSYIIETNKERSYFSNKLKAKLNLTDTQYKNLCREIENKTPEEVAQTHPKVSEAICKIIEEIELERHNGTMRAITGNLITEYLLLNAQKDAVGILDGKYNSIPDYLLNDAFDNDLLIIGP